MLARTEPQTLPAAGPVSVKGLTVAYRDVVAVDHLDWTSPERGLVAVVGPNGAGKSTLLKAILGLVPSSGTITLAGRSIAEQRATTAYVPQRASVDWEFPASALDVVLQGMVRRVGWLRPYSRADRELARHQLDRVGMADLAGRQIGAMSGGQQQRVFLARGLARDAGILMLDEPLAGVDAASEAIILDVFDALYAQGRLVICVHHDLSTVAERFDHVLLMNRHLVAAGPIAEAFTSETLARAYGVPLATRTT